MENRITTLFDIRYPIIAGGMIWCSGWRLAAAVSDAGGLGLIGAGSMTPDLLREHIRKCRAATGKPFGVNVPLMYRYAEQIMQVVMEERVPAVFTSAGSPKTWTGQLHAAGCKVAHVVSSTKFALKCQEAGVDAVVAEGFEAGGHNGREETATMALVPQVRAAITIPLIAAGGIATGMRGETPADAAVPPAASSAERVGIVVCGRRTVYADSLLEYARGRHMASRVDFIYELSPDDLPALFRLAHAFVYLPDAGIEASIVPVVEAMRAGVPMVLSDTQLNREAAGDAAAYVRPEAAGEVAAALENVLSDVNFRREMKARERRRAELFSEYAVARRLIDIYSSL